ncbi:MAG: hypothetical protein OXD40_09485 [bacterium]|nr:hypothetical protein [bacterium]
MTKDVKDAPEGPETTLEAPSNWPKADRAMFAKQPPEAQAYLLDRDRRLNADYTRKMQDGKVYRDLAETWASYFDHVDATPTEVFTRLIETDRALRYGDDAARFTAVASVISQYGIDPRQFAQAVMAVTAQQGAVVEAQAAQASQEQAAAADRERRAMATATSMNRMAGNRGEYPHYQALAGAINDAARKALDRGETPDVHRLYTESAWSDPAIRTALIADERNQAAAGAAAAVETERRAKATKARRAGVGISGAGGEPMPRSGMSVEELLAQEMGMAVPRA